MAAPPAFLRTYGPAATADGHPFITLTYAQSLDAKIAGAGRRQIRLSGEESMMMTHWMRSMHDAILVGIGTAINDDPRLNVRLLPTSHHYLTPQPLILDPNLRLPISARLLTMLSGPLAAGGVVKQPWLICRDDSGGGSKGGERQSEFDKRRKALVDAGARIIPVPMPGGRMDLTTLPGVLQDLGIRSLMVEGGAEIIRQFLTSKVADGDGLHAAENDDDDDGNNKRPERSHHQRPLPQRPLADLLVVTIAPILVPDGYNVLPSPFPSPSPSSVGNTVPEISSGVPTTTTVPYEHCHTEVMGRDAVMVLRAING